MKVYVVNRNIYLVGVYRLLKDAEKAIDDNVEKERISKTRLGFRENDIRNEFYIYSCELK